MIHNKKKSGSASVASAVAYFLKFQYLTDAFVKLKSRKRRKSSQNCELYQNYLQDKKKLLKKNNNVTINNNVIPKRNKAENNYCNYLEEAIFGSPVVMDNVDMEHLIVKSNNKGLVPKLLSCDDERRPTDDIIRHNLEKVQFYEQNQTCESVDDIFVSIHKCLLIFVFHYL